MAEVRLDAVRKRIGGTDVIEGLSLTVQDGELFTLVGPSGCGKSTLLHLIAGLERPTSGRIYFDGEDVTLREPRERDVALVFQSYALYPHMTVAANLAFPLRVGRRRVAAADVQRQVHRVADILGLQALLDRRPRELSGGQRQRVALGRAIIRQPRVFLLDEPLSNLDTQLRAGTRVELRRLHDHLGITMIYVTHDQTEAMTLADRLAVLDHGQIQQIGTPQEVYDRPANVFVAGFIGQPPMNLFNARLAAGRIVAEPVELSLANSIHTALSRDGEVILGVRPEEVRIGRTEGSRDGSRDGSRIAERTSTLGRITLVEPAAGQTWVTVELQLGRTPANLVGLGETRLKARPGDIVPVSFEQARLHLFDRVNGQRVDRPQTAEASAG
jgi:multiple sugar transport system ATP-binding protein